MFHFIYEIIAIISESLVFCRAEMLKTFSLLESFNAIETIEI